MTNESSLLVMTTIVIIVHMVVRRLDRAAAAVWSDSQTSQRVNRGLVLVQSQHNQLQQKLMFP
jgi:hypothetical protein